jgi:hypothetical protein
VVPIANGVMTFWEGPMNSTIEACIESMRRVYGDVTVFTLDDVPRRIRRRSSRGFLGLTDTFRWWAIHRHGGLWLDADVLCCKPIPYQKDLEQYEFMGVGNGMKTNISNVSIAGRKGSKLVERLYHVGLERSGKYPGRVITQMWRENQDKCLKRPKLDCIHPIHYKWEPYIEPRYSTHPWYGAKSYHLGGLCVEWLENNKRDYPNTFVQRLIYDHRRLV